MELVTRIPSILTILNSKCPRAGLSLSTRGLPRTEGIPNRKRRLLGRIPDCSDEISLTETGHFKQGGWHVLRDQWQKSSPLLFSIPVLLLSGRGSLCCLQEYSIFLPLFLCEGYRRAARGACGSKAAWNQLHMVGQKKIILLLLCLPDYQHMVKHPELQIYSNKWR